MTTCVCATCNIKFERYAISATRAAEPQYCSKECMNIGLHKRAQENIKIRLFKRIKVGTPDECWEWTHRKDPNGYGRIDIGKIPRLAHRIAFEIANGFTAENVCHSCDNPPCCNPSHLFAGNPSINNDDMTKKGRRKLPPIRRGNTNNMSKLTEEQTLYILESTETNSKLAKIFGVSKTAIRLIRIGKNWAHLQEKINGKKGI